MKMSGEKSFSSTKEKKKNKVLLDDFVSRYCCHKIKIKVERMLRTIKNDGAKDHQVSQIMCMKFLDDGKIRGGGCHRQMLYCID